MCVTASRPAHSQNCRDSSPYLKLVARCFVIVYMYIRTRINDPCLFGLVVLFFVYIVLSASRLEIIDYVRIASSRILPEKRSITFAAGMGS